MDLDKAYSVKTPEDSRKLYAEWASTYNETFIKANDYVYPRTIAQKFDEFVPGTEITTVVDIGCGTGAVGGFLANLRHELEIIGVDISREMLTEASKTKRIDGSPVYNDLIEADLTTELPKMSFDAMISAGTFTHGHLGAATFISLIELVRVNGWLVIGINAKHFSSQGFDTALQSAQMNARTTHAQFHNVQIYGPKSPHFGDLATIAIFQRL